LIDWSYDLLAEPERLLLHRLAIFAGGWSLEAAETICAGGPLKEEEILDLLTQLVHKSLVVMDEQDDEASYHMLGTIRQYALEKLAACGEMMALAEQHLAYYLKFIELDEPVRSGPEQTAWFERLSREQDNLRAAFAWAQIHDPDRAQRLSRSIWWFWYLREDNP
jgi:predicted ATPase